MRRSALPAWLLLAVLAVELVDELVDGVRGASRPRVRRDLGLSYAQVGLLFTVPSILASFVEPAIGLAADAWRRRVLVLGGGIAFVAAMAGVAASAGYLALMASWVLFYPASGAFVSLSQASLMDADPQRREQNMARWTVAGTLGHIVGPLGVAAVVAAGAGWRPAFAGLAVLAALAAAGMARFPFPATQDGAPGRGAVLREAVTALRRRDVLGRLVLLELSDLMLDVLTAFLALYLVDAGGLTPAQAALVVGARAVASFAGELGVTALLERVPGMRVLRWSVLVASACYPAFLLAPWTWSKVTLAPALGLATAGWYSILKARLYAALPGRSGTVVAIGNVTGLLWGLVPAGLGAIADAAGIAATMWLLWVGPLLLLAALAGRSARAGV